MFIDVEGGAVNFKIALAASEPGLAPAWVRALAARTPEEANGELCEPAPGGIRLLGFDWFVKERVLETGEVAHPHVYAVEETESEPMTPYERLSLLSGADALVLIGARLPELEHQAAERSVRLVRVEASKLDATLSELIALGMREAAAQAPEG